jgi:hypothetical protein
VPTDASRTVAGDPSIASHSQAEENSQRKPFSLCSQSVAEGPRDPGTVGTGLALLLIEQMLKRVLTNFFNF